MRASVMAGTALIIIGGTIFLRGLSAPETDVGAVLITTGGGILISPWVTGLAVLTGIVLVTIGKRRKA